MNIITYIRLVNRILVKSGVNNRVENIIKIIEIAERYKLALIFGTNGAFVNGPFIDTVKIADVPVITSIYTVNNTTINIKEFMSFVEEIGEYCDMYQGAKSLTKMEFYLKYQLIQDNTVHTGDVLFIVYYDMMQDKLICRALNVDEPTIIKLRPRDQYRITEESLKKENAEKELFASTIA